MAYFQAVEEADEVEGAWDEANGDQTMARRPTREFRHAEFRHAA